MKGLSLAVCGLAALLASVSGSAAPVSQPDDVIGRWATPSKHGEVEITPCGTSVCGRLMSSDAIRANADARDTKNSDAALRSRPLKGLMLLGGFHRTRGGWDGGTIYNPEDGGTYHATMTLAGVDTITLKGCIVWPLCKSQTWQRLH